MLEALNKIFSLSGDQLTFLVFGLACGIMAIVLLLLLKAYLRNRALKPIGGKSLGGMDLDELEKMRQTGLLNQEEVKHIRHQLAQQFVERKSERKKHVGQLPVEQLMALAEEEALQAGTEALLTGAEAHLSGAETRQSGEAPAKEMAAADPLDFDLAPKAAPSSTLPDKPPPAAKKPNKPLPAKARFDLDKLDPIEIDELFNFGAITKEEYEAVKQRRGLT